MKKLALTIVCLSALTGVVFAQGSVNWSTISAAAMTAQTNSSQFSPLFGGGSGAGPSGDISVAGGGFYFQLLFNTTLVRSTNANPTTLAELATWQDAGLSATNSTAQAGKLVPINGTTQATVPWAAGVTNNIMLVGWSANLGTTWSAVSTKLQNWDWFYPSAYFGMSRTGWISPNNFNPGATMFGLAQTSAGMPISSLNMQLYFLPIPEPGTMALAGLGGLILLMFRRRKA
jgi:hypothetical protein